VSAVEDDSGKQRDNDDENGETDMDSDTAGTSGESDTDAGENQEPTVPEEASPSEGDDAPSDDEEQPSDDQEEQVGPMVTHAGAESGEHAPGDQGDLSEAFEQPMDFDSDVAKQLSQNAKKELSHSQYRVFSTDWDTLKSAPLGDHKAVEVMVKVTDHMVAGIQKSLERAMAAKARKTWSGGQRRGRINPGSLFRTAVGDDRVFRKRYETAAKNTAVTLLVDCSGSMSGERLALAAQAAYALSSTLERLKIKNEVLGFTTECCKEMALAISRESNAYDFYSRSSSIYMPLFKGFDERLTIDAKLRLAALTNKPMWLRENVDGESVQLAANRLRRQVAERHVLIVLSDGIPACEGTSAALSNHLKRVVSELPSQGVEVVGIGIQTTDVAMFYPRNLTLNNIESLPVTVVNELSRLLLAV
jgi:cobalamin biosynthesis protein CobT